MKANHKLYVAGLTQLFNNDPETFIDRLATLVEAREGMINYLTEGPLEITDEMLNNIKAKISEDIANDEDFIKIESVTTGFDYSLERRIDVKYVAVRYYNSNNQPYMGQTYKDDEHPIGKPTLLTWNLMPEEIKPFIY